MRENNAVADLVFKFVLLGGVLAMIAILGLIYWMVT